MLRLYTPAGYVIVADRLMRTTCRWRVTAANRHGLCLEQCRYVVPAEFIRYPNPGSKLMRYNHNHTP